MLFSSRFLHSVESLKAFLFPQIRNTDLMVIALNSHSDHHRIEIKKILPKISFVLSLQTRSKLLLYHNNAFSEGVSGNGFSLNFLRNKLQLNSQITVFGGEDVSSCSIVDRASRTFSTVIFFLDEQSQGYALWVFMLCQLCLQRKNYFLIKDGRIVGEVECIENQGTVEVTQGEHVFLIMGDYYLADKKGCL
ncbi:hypothetical protein CXB51_025764 [Gossypium anomalum]|uniref:Uncharacterized protein n=1 Tax=Gossypium anomalum TaxID=47600 RepID=A0A8J6CV40_9ROSI|nr:hypothetical protein CXB51_025764 [Gossypium anomalum]